MQIKQIGCQNGPNAMLTPPGQDGRPHTAKHWTLDTGHWTLDTGHWTLDTGHWTLDTGHWTDTGQPLTRQTLDFSQPTGK
ncbi:uncharacterized protein PG986_004341 [Apiospora aurea]|uniref:Uncharacterized protein n=1 Tax=Apiospora aurea TaxID=335848 RepID=A0ABR1QMS8_9PEZI